MPEEYEDDMIEYMTPESDPLSKVAPKIIIKTVALAERAPAVMYKQEKIGDFNLIVKLADEDDFNDLVTSQNSLTCTDDTGTHTVNKEQNISSSSNGNNNNTADSKKRKCDDTGHTGDEQKLADSISSWWATFTASDATTGAAAYCTTSACHLNTLVHTSSTQYTPQQIFQHGLAKDKNKQAHTTIGERLDFGALTHSNRKHRETASTPITYINTTVTSTTCCLKCLHSRE
eukprot:6149-Heterococcus_DN1.PRE.4